VSVEMASGVRASRGVSVPSAALLGGAARFWFIAALIGQWIFASYIAAAYIGHVLIGEWQGMAQTMPNAYVNGDLFGNFAVALHMTLALAIMIGGPLQLVPSLRARFPVFHRWNGRTYLVGAVFASIAGLFMIWGRGTYSLGVKLGGTGNAVLILGFAALALRAALHRDFVTHRRWALRLFITGSAVWFFRVILMAWVSAFGPLGINFETASGPFLELMAFGQYLIPLAVLEGYFLAKASNSLRLQRTMASILVLCTLVMGGGIAVASMAEWLAWM
jgi:hypothetical protein